MHVLGILYRLTRRDHSEGSRPCIAVPNGAADARFQANTVTKWPKTA